MSKLHNTKIYIDNTNYRQLLKQYIKIRDNYLDNNNIKYYENKIKYKKNILFLANDINESKSFYDYKLIIHGILQCGSKTTVIINNIYPYIDLKYDDNKSKEENLSYIKTLCKHDFLKKKLKGRLINIQSFELNEGKEFMLFNEKKSKFIRIYFNKLFHRKCFIQLLTKLNIISYNNDESCYYRVVSRNYNINLAGWNELTNYTIKYDNKYKSKYVIHINKENINLFDENNYLTNGYNPNDIDLFRKDKLISMSYDIEQYCAKFDPNKPEIAAFPSGKVKEDIVFNIGMTFQFINESESFLNINLLTKDANIHNDYFTIICSDEIILLKSFAYINNLLLPDFIMEFNGSEFDWIVLYDKCKLYNILEQFCQDLSIKIIDQYEINKGQLDYYFKEKSVKISADNPHKAMRNIKLEGYIPFDVRVILMQLNPTSNKSSLRFYLDLYNLPNKDDMPIPKLFKIYLDNDIIGMTDVAHYCYIDSFSLHRLVYKNNIIQDKREVSRLSYTSLFDAFYNAGAHKICNLIIGKAIKQNLFINTIKKEIREEDKKKGKFPGALVLPPKKGLINNVMTIKEFMQNTLDIYDKELIEQAQNIITDNYESFYIKRDISNIKFD